MKKYLSLLIVSLVLFSCREDLLDPFTPGAVTEELAVRNSGDLQRLMNSAQNIMTNRTEYVFSSIFTDEAAPGFNNGGQGIAGSDAYYLFFMNPSSSAPASIWASNYNAMSRVNLILSKVDGITPASTADGLLLKRIKAEALILRALAHLKVLAYFSPDTKNNAALAGVIANRVFAYTETPSRATNGETYTFIHKDLDDALALYANNALPALTATTTNNTPGKNLAMALKARAYAYKGDYTNAEIWANNVINNSGITLAAASALGTVFHTHTVAATSEVIYRFERTAAQNAQGSNLHNGWVSVSNSRGGSPFYEVSRSLYNALTAMPGDARTDIIVRPASSTTSSGSLIDPNYATATNVRNTDILVPFKHGGSSAATSTNGNNPDFIQMRLSEMYFIKAEARAAAADYTGVAAALKAITDVRFATPPAQLVLTTAQEAWKAILDERRKELAFEGHRYIDLKRLATLAGVTSFDRHPADYAPTGLNFPGANPSNFVFATTHKWAMPIPFIEINANSAFTQNTGY